MQAEQMTQEWVAVADDDPQVLQALQEVLTFLGLPCRVYDSAESLLADVSCVDGRWMLNLPAGQAEGQAQEQAVGLRAVVLDMNLPGMSGADLAQALLRQQPKLKVVMISAVLVSELQSQLSDLTGVTVLSKPFDLAALEQALGAA